MARTSRKKITANPVQAVSPSQIFPTAIYARLSVENSGKDDEGAALENQIAVCEEYIKACPHLELIETYSDNGRTGTVFDRPAFNRLMGDIRCGRIKCIVVRDLSRFGRDYVETGTYIERIFPQLDVRFISIKENFDTFATDGSNDCLYRVSTDKQVDYNDKSQADIPMQRRECHRFCEKMGWTIVHEEQEDGVSGHKVRAENRDKLQIIKERAKQGKFDILLVFMFDRIGRIADETPFVVEWFVKNGIRVWSTQEGEQRFDNHTDKLTNYIRFWQADGESEKTSIRTKTALGQLVEDGGFKGGLAPYGYDLVKSGRFNKRKHEVFELAINEAEAAVVRIIFDKYVHEGFGAQRIATYLNSLGYRARTGKMWHHASIRGIICNLTYTGVLRSGESRSQTLPHLQIITPELFEAAQHIRTSRANSAEQERRVPLNTRGQSLLAGNVFCGHCGSRLALTTNGKAYPCKEDAHRIVKRVRYICYGKTRKQTECDGQTGYTAHILDGIIDKVVRQIFERMKAIPKSEIVNIRYREKMEERKALLKSAKSDYAKAAAELDTLRTEVIKSLRGESAFSQDLLSSLIADNEKKCLTIQRTMEAAQAAYGEGQAMLDTLNAQYDDIISWADMYDSASMEAKKMIVNCLIKRVDVYRDYKLHIDFNIDFEQFSMGIDIISIAA